MVSIIENLAFESDEVKTVVQFVKDLISNADCIPALETYIEILKKHGDKKEIVAVRLFFILFNILNLNLFSF
jgi:hypothetical protein